MIINKDLDKNDLRMKSITEARLGRNISYQLQVGFCADQELQVQQLHSHNVS